MLEAYSLGVSVLAGAAIPFNNVTVEKGCTATIASPATVQLNKCGVYMVAVDASAAAAATIQLYKDDVAQPQAQSTGNSPSFTTLVQVSRNNSDCVCSSPTLLQVRTPAAATFTDANIVVTKIC